MDIAVGIIVIVFLGLMFVAATVGSILFFAGRPHSGIRRVGGSMALVCGLMLAVLLVLGTTLVGYRAAAVPATPVSPSELRALAQPYRAGSHADSNIGVRIEVQSDHVGSHVDSPDLSSGHEPFSVSPPSAPWESSPSWTTVNQSRLGFVKGITWLLVAAIGVAAVLFFVTRPRSAVHAVPRGHRSVSPGLLLVIGLLAIPSLLIVAAVFIPSIQQLREEGRREEARQRLKQIGFRHHESHDGLMEHGEGSPGAPPAPLVVADSVDAGLSRLPDDDRPADAQEALNGHDDRTPVAAAARPDWTNAGEARNGDVTRFVLSSKQYATIDEARREIADQARQLLAQDFQRIYHASAEGVRDLPLDILRRLAVRQEHVETVERDFGNFFAPMHRVWWQVETSPEIRTHLRALWRNDVQETRMFQVAGMFAAITVLLAIFSLVARRWHAAAR